MINIHATEGFLLTFKQPDLNKLRAECYAEILKHHANEHDKIMVQFRICFWKKKYLMITQMPVIGTDRKTNKATKIYRGVGAMRNYIIAKWKFDHAQAHEIEWNVVTFECDGESVRTDTSFSEAVLKQAEKDVQAGAIDRTLTGAGNFLKGIGDKVYSLFSKRS